MEVLKQGYLLQHGSFQVRLPFLLSETQLTPSQGRCKLASHLTPLVTKVCGWLAPEPAAWLTFTAH